MRNASQQKTRAIVVMCTQRKAFQIGNLPEFASFTDEIGRREAASLTTIVLWRAQRPTGFYLAAWLDGIRDPVITVKLALSYSPYQTGLPSSSFIRRILSFMDAWIPFLLVVLMVNLSFLILYVRLGVMYNKSYYYHQVFSLARWTKTGQQTFCQEDKLSA